MLFKCLENTILNKTYHPHYVF